MKPLLIILGYFLGVVLIGAALAPPLYWALHALEPWEQTNGLLHFDPQGSEVVAKGALAFLATADFQKIFHRAILVAAVALLWPVIRALRIRGFADIGLRPDPRRWSHLRFGFIVAGGVVAVMAAGYLILNFYHLKKPLPWAALPRLALTAAVVAVIEECLFRGAILGLFLRSMRPMPALAWTTFLFGILHYLRPGEEDIVRQVHWDSGFRLLPDLFYLFGDPLMLLASLSTLLVLGWLLGYARLRTGALWMSIGIHAGVVFVKMGFSKLTKRDLVAMPWVGPELQIGLVPVVLLLLALWVCYRRLEYEELLPNPKPRA